MEFSRTTSRAIGNVPLKSDTPIGEVACSEIGALESGEMLAREFEGRKVLLCKVENAVYALENRCSHAAAELSGGRLDGYEIECPFHGARFDIRSGAALSPPARAGVVVFDVVSTDSGVEIRWRRSEE